MSTDDSASGIGMNARQSVSSHTFVWSIPLDPKLLLTAHLSAIAVLLIANCAVILGMSSGKIEEITFFLFDREANLPTFFSTFILIESSFLLLVIGISERIKRTALSNYWLLLCLIFFGMAIDETAQIHEKTMAPIRSLLHLEGIGLLYNSWVILGFLFVFLFLVIYLRFIWLIDRTVSTIMVSAGVIYVTGALIVEMLSGYLKHLYGYSSTEFLFSTTIEETFEMLGVTIFIYALTLYLRKERVSLGIVQLSTDNEPQSLES